MSAADPECPLNESDFAACIRILTERSPKTQAELARCERVGLPIPQVKEKDDANRTAAELILREFCPHRLPQPISPVG